MRLLVVSLSPQIFPRHPYTHMGICLFESSGQIFITSPKLNGVVKILFNTLSSRSFISFVLHLPHLNKEVYLPEAFISSIWFLHLPHLTSLVPHKLVARLSRLDAINLQLSINLKWIFLRTSVPSLLLNPANFLLILTLKLIFFSLFSEMTPISFLLNFLPCSLMKKWAL